MRELHAGLCHWQARHPEWQSSEPWHRNVSSYAVDTGERLLLSDPSDIETLAAERETAVGTLKRRNKRDAFLVVARIDGAEGDHRAEAMTTNCRSRPFHVGPTYSIEVP